MSQSGSSSVRIGRVFTGLLAATALVLLALPASGRAAEATAVFTPGSQSFTATIVGQRSTQQYFELRDEGPESIQVSTVAIGGPDSADFSLESSSCFGTTLSAGSSCWAYVAFTPTQGGTREATLVALHDGEGSPTTAALEGTGLRQEVTLSPSPLVFPTTTKYMSSEKQLTIENQSDVAVTVFGTNFEGPGASAFGTTGSNCAGTLGVGSTCTVDVRFNPQSAGEQRAFLHINAEGPGGGPIVELQGLGAAPELSFEPGSFDFGLAPTNEGSERTRMVLRNVGPAPTQVGIETSGGSGAFSIGESDCWGATLAPEGTCSLQVYFRPSETGPYAGVVRATSAGVSFDAELTGVGGQAVLSASPSPLDFGSAAVGSRSEPRTVTIENSGNLAGGFFIAVISGGDSASFQLIEEDCTGTPIAPGGKCQAVVRFQPTGAGLRRATLSMFGDGEGGQQIALSGSGVDPGLPTSLPSSHSFGTQAVGTSGGVQLFTFTNQSAIATELAVANLGGDDPDQFRIAHDACSETSLAPAASCQIGVRFAPGEEGAKSAILRLGSTGGVATAALSGFAEGAVGTAAMSATSPRAALRLAGRPLHLAGRTLRVGTFSCLSEQDCQVVTRATIVKSPASIKTTGARPIGPWSTKLAVPAGAKRELVLHLGVADLAAARDGRLRLRWESRSGSRRSTGSAEVSLR